MSMSFGSLFQLTAGLRASVYSSYLLEARQHLIYGLNP